MAGLVLLLAGCVADDVAAPAAPGAAPPLAGPASPQALAEHLPPSADRFSRGATLPVFQPMEGLEVNYATATRRSAAFVQLVRPVSGTAEAAAAAEYTRWRTEASTRERSGRRLAVVEEFTDATGPGFRCAALEGSYGRQPVQSMICVGATGGHVLRLRVSMMRETPPAGDARAFLREVARGLPAS